MGRFTVIKERAARTQGDGPENPQWISEMHPKVRDVRLRREAAAASRRTEHERSGRYRKIREKFPRD
jgi:hypothetical protein